MMGRRKILGVERTTGKEFGYAEPKIPSPREPKERDTTHPVVLSERSAEKTGKDGGSVLDRTKSGVGQEKEED